MKYLIALFMFVSFGSLAGELSCRLDNKEDTFIKLSEARGEILVEFSDKSSPPNKLERIGAYSVLGKNYYETKEKRSGSDGSYYIFIGRNDVGGSVMFSIAESDNGKVGDFDVYNPDQSLAYSAACYPQSIKHTSTIFTNGIRSPIK